MNESITYFAKSVGICRIFNNFATEYIYEEKATAAFVSLSN